jgi:tetratricopeptide (TPR) repeat protein
MIESGRQGADRFGVELLRLDAPAPVVSRTAAQNRRLRWLVRILGVGLVIAVPLLLAVYFVAQNPNPGPTLVQRTVAAAEQAVRQSPDAIAPRLELAAAYLADSRPQDAAVQYDEVLKATPDNVPALLGRAGIGETAGDHAGALQLYQRVVDLRKGGEMAAADTDLEHAYYAIGSISDEQHHYPEAIAALESAVRIDGADADAWYLLGKAQLDAGVPEKAVEAERNAIAFVPMGWSDPYSLLAQAYAIQGKTANSAWAQAMLALIAKQYPEAKAQLTALVGGPAAEDASLGLAFLAEIQGDTAGAIDWYRKVVAIDPKNTLASDGVSRLGGASAAPIPDASSAAPAGS